MRECAWVLLSQRRGHTFINNTSADTLESNLSCLSSLAQVQCSQKRHLSHYVMLSCLLEQETGMLDVSALDMTPQDWVAFQAAVDQGELVHMVAPWQPWWMTQDAHDLQLNHQGQRMITGSAGCNVHALSQGLDLSKGWIVQTMIWQNH